MIPDDAPPFAAELRRLRQVRGLSLRDLAARVHYGKSYLHDLETGRKRPPPVARDLDDVLTAGGRLTAAAQESAAPADDGSEVEALELARRVAASDVSAETLGRLERATDALATSTCGGPLRRHGRP